MALAVNKDIVTWALAVIQPASIGELRGFLVHALKDESAVPSGDIIANEIRELVDLKDISKVGFKPARYSVTRKGEQRIQKKLRHLRDRMRLFLMKNASYSRFYQSSEVLDKNLDDVSSSSSIGTTIQDAQRPNVSLVADQRAIWPLVSEQFQIGSVSTSGDLKPALPFYSFGHPYFTEGIGSTQELAEAIGVSTRLITSIAKNKPKHYRSFEMPKKSGGTRQIDSPRTFLKVIQRWINDYLLTSLRQHEKCMSYRRGYSVRTHASLHEEKEYVLNLDIENFFGSITKSNIERLLLESGYREELVSILKELTTFRNVLPQGAPTSPVLSNALLYRFDEHIDSVSKNKGVMYSRYADDITLSGDNKEALEKVKDEISRELQAYELQIKAKKTRMTHKSQKQVVTGLVVNQRAKPSRDYRRLIRAIFHAAEKSPDSFSGKSHVLNGYIAYLNAYDCLKKETKEHYLKITHQIALVPMTVRLEETKNQEAQPSKPNLLALYKQGKYQDIIIAAETFPVLDNEEESTVAFAYFALAVKQQHKNDEIQLYDSLIKKFLDSKNITVQLHVAKAIMNKGSSLRTLNRSEDAIYTYDQILERFGDATEPMLREQVAKALFNKGITLSALDRAEESIAAYDQLLKQFGDAAEPALRELVATAMVNKGITLGALDRTEDEIAVYDQLLKQFGDATEPALRELVAKAMLNKGFKLGGLDRAEDEIAVYDQLLKQFGDATEPALRELVAKAMVNKGFKLGALDRAEDEIAVYDQLLKRFGDAAEPELKEVVVGVMALKAKLSIRG